MSTKVKNANKELDRMNSMGSSKIYRAEKLKKEISEEMKKEGVKEAVMDYIFGGDPDAVSPLEEIRKENK